MKLYDISGKPSNIKQLAEIEKLAVYPGSFNPLHKGHRGIYDLLWKNGYHVVFEMSKSRYQKEPYSDEKFNQLILQFRDYSPVLVSEAPLFSDKRDQLNIFDPFWVMGYDTAKRWIDENRFVDAKEQKKINKMKVLFIGRLTAGVYYDPKDLLDGSESYQWTIFDFKCDISSTEIRNAQ